MDSAMGIQTSLDSVRNAPRIVDAMRLSDELAFDASRDAGTRTIRVLVGAISGDDQLLAIAAVHALGQVTDETADDALSLLLSSERAFVREHATWVLGSRPPRLDSIGRLLRTVTDGGFSGMLAQRTLQQWATSAPIQLSIALESALVGITDSAARFRLVETLGLVPGRIATRVLVNIVKDSNESIDVRVAAVSGLGEREADSEIAAIVSSLASGEGYLADAARLAVVDLTSRPAERAPWQDGLTVAQLFLHADIDPQLTRAGSGDNGGIATLLVRLGDAMVASADSETRSIGERAAVQRVLTLSRGSSAEALESVFQVGSTVTGHSYASVPLLSEPVASAAAWPLRIAAERGIRRILRAAGTVDVLHLRMADVGSLAAADVARDLDIPIVFTVAPDPHAVIESLDAAGKLTRANFGDIDAHEHFWFRTRLVQRLAANAAHTVLFPRPQLEQDMKELVGIDISAHPERHSIVPEGIDLGVVDRAGLEAADYVAGGSPTAAFGELRELIETLPVDRQALPLIISVGRFHRVKGMASIVEAWSTGPLRDRANLLLIGGDLASPSADEQEQLTLMDALIAPDARAASGLLLPGHRPNDTVARWVAAARSGLPGLTAPHGLYVCGSLKEEFGIALLEAMAAGLLVVAPDGGGPATYVENGITGYLAKTWDVPQLAAAMLAAFETASRESDTIRSDRSRNTVVQSFTIEAMARALSAVYAKVDQEESAFSLKSLIA